MALGMGFGECLLGCLPAGWGLCLDNPFRPSPWLSFVGSLVVASWAGLRRCSGRCSGKGWRLGFGVGLPANGDAAPSETGAEGNENDKVAGQNSAGLAGFVKGDDGGGRAGVGVFLDVDEDVVHRETE